MNPDDVPPPNTNPSLHLIIRGSEKTVSLCRTVSSALLLNYPQPVVAHLEKQPNIGKGTLPRRTNAILAINTYLTETTDMKDDDVVMIVDSSDSWFQLPPDVILRRFHNILRENNRRLRRKYGYVQVDNGQSDGVPKFMQKFSQRILFGASKFCWPIRQNDPACLAVPFSTLPPDVYGPYTDISRKLTTNRPRWLNSGTLIGLAGDVHLLYSHLAEVSRKSDVLVDEWRLLEQTFGEQEYVRELDRQTTTPSWLVRLGEIAGIIDKPDISQATMKVVPGKRYDYGIGLDYKSQLFFSIAHSQGDIEWVRYDNLTQMTHAQVMHFVPRETRINLPLDVADSANPFAPRPQSTLPKPVTPPFNSTWDTLPNFQHNSWRTIPLVTNVHSASVPALLQMNGVDTVRNPFWWGMMWYPPFSRSLLRNRMRSFNGSVVSKTSLSSGGSSESWNLHSGESDTFSQWTALEEVCENLGNTVTGDHNHILGLESNQDKQPNLPKDRRLGVFVVAKEKEKKDEEPNDGDL